MTEYMFKPPLPPFRTYKKTVFTHAMKTGSFVYQIGETPKLREKSKEIPVKEITTKETQAKLAYLKQCLIKYRKLTGAGRGITAVQVGIPERFSVIWMPQGKPTKLIKEKDLLVIINPIITKKASTLLRYPEICMSANPIIAPVVRPSWIEFSYYDEFGKKQYWDQKDTDRNGKMYNRVLQHEIDHMDGIINIDRVQSKELIFESDPTFYDKTEFEPITSK